MAPRAQLAVRQDLLPGRTEHHLRPLLQAVEVSKHLSDGPPESCSPWHPILCRMRLIIQTILLDPSGAVWTDGASNVSRPDPSGAIPVDAEHPTRNRKVVGSMSHEQRGRRDLCCRGRAFHGGLVQQLGSCGPGLWPCGRHTHPGFAALAGRRKTRTSSWAMIRMGSPRARGGEPAGHGVVRPAGLRCVRTAPARPPRPPP
jgi:hypothetical protein